jgi:hypothetical protein
VTSLRVPPALARHFADFAALLRGEIDAGEVERRAGATAHPQRGLAFYAVLARRNHELAVCQCCPATTAVLRAHGAFESLVRELGERRPPTSSDPNRFADALPEVLADHAELPSWIVELADLEVTRQRCGVADFEPSVSDPGLDRALFVRCYEHDVPALLLGFDGSGRWDEPARRTTAVLVHRDPRSGLPRLYLPTALGLAAVARRLGEPVAGAPAAALDGAERELVAAGVLPS